MKTLFCAETYLIVIPMHPPSCPPLPPLGWLPHPCLAGLAGLTWSASGADSQTGLSASAVQTDKRLIKVYLYHMGTSIRQAPVFRHLRAFRKSPWKFHYLDEWIIITLHVAGFLHVYIQQYVNTSITVLTNQLWKLLIALFKVRNTGALTVPKNWVCDWSLL